MFKSKYQIITENNSTFYVIRYHWFFGKQVLSTYKVNKEFKIQWNSFKFLKDYESLYSTSNSKYTTNQYLEFALNPKLLKTIKNTSTETVVKEIII